MKIICSSCKKVIGIQRPFNDNSEISAKCPGCFEKEKKEALKPQPLPAPGERKVIIFGGGVKGYLMVADDTTKLSMSDIVVSGKTFECTKELRDNFLEYLEMIEKDQVEIVFLESTATKIDSPLRGCRKKNESDRPTEDKPKSINYNCTVTIPKHHTILMYDNKVAQTEALLGVIAEILAKEWMAEP